MGTIQMLLLSLLVLLLLLLLFLLLMILTHSLTTKANTAVSVFVLSKNSTKNHHFPDIHLTHPGMRGRCWIPYGDGSAMFVEFPSPQKQTTDSNKGRFSAQLTEMILGAVL